MLCNNSESTLGVDFLCHTKGAEMKNRRQLQCSCPRFLVSFFCRLRHPNAKNSGNTPTNNSGANNSGNSNAAETEEPVPARSPHPIISSGKYAVKQKVSLPKVCLPAPHFTTDEVFTDGQTAILPNIYPRTDGAVLMYGPA
jgi:hypothetical protein